MAELPRREISAAAPHLSDTPASLLGTPLPRGRTIPLINEQMKLKCELVGADGHVSKPQNPELVERVDGKPFRSRRI